jgi:hypothetical protein
VRQDTSLTARNSPSRRPTAYAMPATTRRMLRPPSDSLPDQLPSLAIEVASDDLALSLKAKLSRLRSGPCAKLIDLRRGAGGSA